MREKDEREGVGESSKANRQGYVHRLDKSATSYFFTNFPDDVKAVDLWPKFARFGRVGEVFIPAKVDKQGKRFGFVKFREVRDATELLRCISNIWIDSFKLRINLSKFHPEEVDGQRREVATKVTPEVIWEVEVEEARMMRLEGACVGYLIEEKDVQAIQYDFNMNGFENLKVCSLGHLQVLLWSEKPGEVKEVMGTVGWWCSLFEKMVPWSPELVSSSRVTWLRCYGVPPHAWGNNLFRSIAFKYGRFIGVDDSTKEMRRCDVARIKITTNDKVAIDSSMAVKVLGRRFDIRIMEEIGEEARSLDRIGGNSGGVWAEEQSSHASGDGASLQAVVEGCSETGSEADISESCQVLLGLEAQGIRRIETGDSMRVLEDKEFDLADNIPNKLGNPVELVANVVNYDSDKRDEVSGESAGKVLSLEGVMTGIDGGAQEDVVAGSDLEGAMEGLAGSVQEGLVGVQDFGPAHQASGSEDVASSDSGGCEELNGVCFPEPVEDIVCDEKARSDSGGCEEIIGERFGPKFLRTKKGDLCLDGVVKAKHGEAHLATKVKKMLSEKHATRSSRPTSKKNNHGVKSIPDLPPKKLRYFSAPPYPRNHPSRKKKAGRKNTPKDIPSDSDSIHNSEISPLETQPTNNEDFVLEVVLPCAPLRVDRTQQAMGTRGEVGTTVMVNDGSNDENSVNHRAGDIVLEPPSRQVMEALKILSIQKQVGITVQSSQEEHLIRIEKMEVRDRAEKEGWELNRETKTDGVSANLCHTLWGNTDCDWACLPAVGNSGGILSIWKKSLGSVVFSIMGEGFVGVCLDLVDKPVRCCVINVYAKCNITDKRRLWREVLMSRRGFGEVAWCIVGDFNSVLNSNERRGVRMANLVTNEMVEFGNFVRDLEMIDMPLLGRQYTWFHPNGFTMSRLDRMLISSDWLALWGCPSVWVASRDVSDHCPLILKYNSDDWGPKPFRFNNYWLKNKNFKELVVNSWTNHNVSGWMGFVLKEKLKGLKGVIKRWSKEVYGKPEDTKLRLVDQIKVLDLKSEDGGLSVEEVVIRKRLFEQLWEVLKSIDASTFQRSHSKWLREGDSNSKYFHGCINARKRMNTISALNTPLGWVEGSVGVREATVAFFKNHFSSEGWHRPNLDGVDFPVLSEGDNMMLIAPFSCEEIEDAVKTSDGGKCPGPDGFNFAFIKEFWDIMKHEVRIMFDQFAGNDCLPRCLLSYFLTLIPKVKSPQELGDFRPISLLGCWYKILAKVLATRLANVIGKLIPKTQSAFLKGRQLVEGVVVVNEVIDYAKKSGKKCVILKVDFEKAYDSVEWEFLDYMLMRFGFSHKWRNWMKACIGAGSLSVLVNGSPTEEVHIKRGLKQDDPLAPLLFLVVAEGLGGLMRRAVDCGRFQPFLIGNNDMEMSLLQYADDTLCIGDATVENLWTLKAALRGFEMSSGLKGGYYSIQVLRPTGGCKSSKVVYLGTDAYGGPKSTRLLGEQICKLGRAYCFNKCGA
ncbi:hypothetical protein QL285_013611 [Trifolium repens]|nr:hypothetical protein QL285_013611 [Trifolium repens]